MCLERGAAECVCVRAQVCACFYLYIDSLITKSKASYSLKCVEELQQETNPNPFIIFSVA